MLAGFRIARIFGVDIEIDWSLAIIFLLILFSLGTQWFPRWHPDWSGVAVWGSALASALLFFASILMHELSHALVARRNGIPVRRITLFMLGGIAHMESAPPSAGAEFRMAAVGPLTSIVIGIAASFVAQAISPPLDPADAQDLATVLGRLGPAASVLAWLGMINVLLGVFNLIPGFPLDGGRVLRAALWRITGDRMKATLWASRVGRVIAVLLIAYGLVQVFAGGALGGIWLALIGWFLYAAARGSYGREVMQDALENVHVRDVMQVRPATVSGEMPLATLVQDYVMQSDQGAFPVVRGDTLVGIVSLEDVRKTPRERWGEVVVADAMTPADQLATLGPEDDATEAFREIATRGLRQIPVVEDGRLRGVIRREDLIKWLSLHAPQRA
ncbi:MAG: site-2 protease family protein [Polyangiaceae bacterium]|nr:site-2 protease family protein [Polyangiaceae bacterium]